MSYKDSGTAKPPLLSAGKVYLAALLAPDFIGAMATPSSREPLPAIFIHEVKYVLTDVGLCFAFFGVQIALFAVGSLTDWWFQFLGGGGARDVNHTLRAIEGLMDTSFHISYHFGDALVVWRAWVIWPDNRNARGLLAACMVFTIGEYTLFAEAPFSERSTSWAGILSTFTVLAITAQEHLKTAKSIGGPRSVLASIRFMDSRNDDDHSEGSEEGACFNDEDQGNYTSIEPLPAFFIDELKYVLTDVCICFALFGIQIALFVGAAVVLARKENRAWIFALSIVAVFFCSSAQAVGSLTDWWFQFLGEGGASDVDHTLGVIEGLIDTSFHISYLVGDALVVWRAWVLWPRSWVARSLLATCMVFTVGKCTLFGSGILLNTPPVGLSVDLYIDFSAVELSKALNAPMIIAVLLTNALATILVGIRVWEYRRNIASALGQNTFGLQVGRILVLLLESGLFYCVIWVCIFAMDVGVGNVELGASIITGRTLHQVATAYPTFVILILTSQQCTTNSTVSHQISLLPPMQFDSGRTGGATDTQETM
ncbi:hypothetical protein K525DRAFT_272057 [Schizophyllum commune Loenen D]|nr:hypothetical protein K525DRAFT_272057 [Schizophyllum commune Loenen D]